MGVMRARIPADYHCMPGQRRIDSDVIDCALVVMPMRRLNHDAAGHEVGREPFELLDALTARSSMAGLPSRLR